MTPEQEEILARYLAQATLQVREALVVFLKDC